MVNRLKTETRILFTSLAIGIFLALGVAASTYVYSAAVHREISENVIRFHVVAHDDSEEEQELKDFVRMTILNEFKESLSENMEITQTRARFQKLLPALQEHAEHAVRQAGFEHEVKVRLANVFFPTQYYGNIAFPAGNYEALQIIIGDGNGQNWWCLMFPPLCYVDMTTTDSTQQLLSENISEDSLRLLLHPESGSPDLIVRFRVVEWWQNR